METPLNLMHMPWPALNPDASLLKTAKLCGIRLCCQDCIRLCFAEHNHMIINQQDAFVWDIKTQVCCAFAAYGEAQVVACRSSA